MRASELRGQRPEVIQMPRTAIVAESKDRLHEWRTDLMHSYEPEELTAPNLIRFLESLTVPVGPHQGEKMTVLPWQKRMLRAFVKADTTVLSAARGSGKTFLAAGLCAYFVAGDGAVLNSKVEIFAGTQLQAYTCLKFVYDLLLHITNPNEWGQSKALPYGYTNKSVIENRDLGIELIARTSSKAAAQGSSPQFLFADELSTWEPNKGAYILQTLLGSLGKVPNSKGLLAGLRPKDPGHFWGNELAKEVKGRKVFLFEGATPDTTKENLMLANPSLKHMPRLMRHCMNEIEAIQGDPKRLATFRSQRLNLGISTEQMDIYSEFLTAAEIAGMMASPGDGRREGPLVIALDPGGAAAMTAAVCYWSDARWGESYSALPVGKTTLTEWNEKHMLPAGSYEMAIKRGECWTYTTTGTPIEPFLDDLIAAVGDEALGAVWLSDKYRYADIEQGLRARGVRDDNVVLRTPRGAGPDGFANRRMVIEEVREGHIRFLRSGLLAASLGAVHTRHDLRNDNPQLMARSQSSRVDLCDAFLLAVGWGHALRTGKSDGLSKERRKKIDTSNFDMYLQA